MEIGDGSGYGNGCGQGYGKSCGFASGKGDGPGFGESHGYGCGYGHGEGDGFGYRDDFVNEQIVTAMLAPHVTCPPDHVLALWRCRANGRPANGGRGAARRVGQTETVDGPLEICTRRALHGTFQPKAWSGDRLFAVALKEPVERGDNKIASLERTILADVTELFRWAM